MYGAYKTPGGKLVQVDFDVVDEQLRNVVVSGDFFLYPEEALAPITAAVEGSSAEMTLSSTSGIASSPSSVRSPSVSSRPQAWRYPLMSVSTSASSRRRPNGG